MISNEHLAMLAASGITAEHAAARGYETITDAARLAGVNVVKPGRLTPGLLVPQLRPDGSTWGYQYRPDEPRLRDGKPVKYETPWQQCNGLDVPPGVGVMLEDPNEPLWITEGVKKADCGALHGLCIVALSGVWNWLGTNSAGGKMTLPDWRDIALNGRRVVIAFDGDVARKASVLKASRALGQYLAYKGARVEHLHLPDTDDKTGLDDYLADHDVGELRRLVKPTAPTPAAPRQQHADVAPDPKPAAPQRPTVEPDGSRFIHPHEGLLTRDLARQVSRSVTCGYNHNDERFYIYDGGVWRPNQGEIETSTGYWLGNRYRQSHCRNAMDLIRFDPDTARITCDPAPEWINVANGMVRWRDQTLHAHSPEYRSTTQLPVAYDPAADCPRFIEFLRSALPADCLDPLDGGPGFIWELIGYTLYSGNPLHNAVLLYGHGRNGKGVFIRALKRIIGAENYSTATVHELAENRFRAATLYGKLANLAGDLDSKWLASTAIFKAITGGDTIQGEHKYGAAFDFEPWALPVYSTNRAFGAADSSEGWVARWVIVPFPNSFLGREDRDLDRKLGANTELQGILRRAVEALPALMGRGRLPEPESVAAAKREFIAASDAVRAWVDETCTLATDAWTPRTELYQSYVRSADDAGSRKLSAHEFYQRIAQIGGVSTVIRRGTRGFAGVCFQHDWDGFTEGAEGAEGAGSTTPTRVCGGKGREPAPPAPQTALDPTDKSGTVSAPDPEPAAPTERNSRYRRGRCIDCGERPPSAGRPRCDSCHAAWRQMGGHK